MRFHSLPPPLPLPAACARLWTTLTPPPPPPAQTRPLTPSRLYKQATAGPCDTPKPSFFDRKGRAKWQAWADRGALSASQAQQQYVELLTRLAPDWAGAPGSSSGGGDGGGKRQGGAGGPVQSRMAEAAEEEEVRERGVWRC